MLYLVLGNVQITLGRADFAFTSFNEAEKESPFIGDADPLGAEFRAQIAEGRQHTMKMSARKVH